MERDEKVEPNLTGVPETMLWTLHNRASEARREDGVIRDPECLRIYAEIDYDFEASFGRANASHGVRSAMSDAEVEAFVEAHGACTVVNLGEGLETQRYRLAGLPVTWVSVDLEEAIEVRERFIEPDERHRHVRCSVLEEAWMDEVPEGPVCITAQGLFMYLPPERIAPLLASMARRFPGAWVSFDTIPPWFSKRTLEGMKLTPSYTAPKMPFGVTRSELPRMVERAVPGARVREILWKFPRGGERFAFPVFRAIPILGKHAPAMWSVQLPS